MTLLDTIAPAKADAGRTRVAPLAHDIGVAWTTRTTLVTVAILALFFAAAFARWWVADVIVPWDSKNHFYPMFRFLADALRHGTVPLWNPYHFAGYPAIADPQSLIFTPSMLVFALLAPDASMPLFDAVIFGHLVFGGVGVLALARRWRWHPAAGLLAALVFAFGGAASGRLEHTGMIISYIYFPWALWSLTGALERRSLPWAVLAGVMMALMALGRDQVAFLLCLGLLGAVADAVFASRTPLAYARDRAPVLACAGLITVAIMIVPILMTLQFVHDSNRPSITYGVALGGSLNPINLLTLIAPNVFGTLDRVYDYWGPGTGLLAGNDWTDKTDRTIDYMFIGTLPCVLLLWQGLAGGRLLDRRLRVPAALGAVALVYALGRNTPLFGIIFDWVPGVSLYRRPADATFALNVALAFAAGHLLDRFVRDGLPRPRAVMPLWLVWLLPAATILAAALLIGDGLAFARRFAHLETSIVELTCSAALAGVAIAVVLAGRGPRHRALVATVLVAATAGELLWRNAASAVNSEPISTYSAYNGLYPDEARGLDVLRGDIARRVAAGERPRVELIGVNGSWQNAAMVLQLEDTIGYNPLRISDYERSVGAMESATEIDLRRFPGLFRGYTGRLAAMLGLDYLVLDRPLDKLPRHFPRPAADLLFSSQGFYVYRLVNQVIPRAEFVEHLKSIASDDVIADERMPNFDPTREALIDSKDVASLREPALVSAAPVDGERAAAVPITTYQDNAVNVDVDAARPGVVVLHDLAYPGWTVSVDGRPAPLLRADILFRGVEIPAGHHTIEFRFEPLAPANLVSAAMGLLRTAKR